MRITRSRLTLVVLLFSCFASAQSADIDKEFDRLCFLSWLSSEQTVGRDFSVKVSFRGAPIAGNRISLLKEGNAVATARTNSHGVALFRAVPLGSYNPHSADGLLFPSGSLVIEVKAGHAFGEKVELDWPSDSISVRNLRGRFTVSEQLSTPEIPLRNAVVELLDLYTARLIESGRTDANGDFEFTTTNPGIYALRLTLFKKDDAGSENRDFAVELDPTAKDYSVPEMKVVQSECAGVQLFRRSQTDDLWEEQ